VSIAELTRALADRDPEVLAWRAYVRGEAVRLPEPGALPLPWRVVDLDAGWRGYVR
jgi:hypothetical protein